MVSSTATADPHTNGHANGNGHINGKDPLGAKIVAAATAVPGVGIKPRSNGAVGEVYKVQERPFETVRAHQGYESRMTADRMVITPASLHPRSMHGCRLLWSVPCLSSAAKMRERRTGHLREEPRCRRNMA